MCICTPSLSIYIVYQQERFMSCQLGKEIPVLWLDLYGELSTLMGNVFNNNNIYLFGVLCRFQHYTGHITTGSWKGRGNQYMQLVKVLYCKLPTNSKQLPAFPLEAVPGTEPRPQRWNARVLPLCHRGP